MIRILILSFCLSFTASCDKRSQEVGGQIIEGLFKVIQEQLIEYFITNAGSMIVALGLSDHSGDINALSYATEEDKGDSLLFSGIALGVVDCDIADTLLTGFERMQNVHEGYLIRYNPLPDEYKENQVSRDGGTGALFGLTRVQKRCPNLKGRAEGVMQRWKEAVGGSPILHPKSKAVITPNFKMFRDVAYGKGMNAAEYAIFMVSNFVTVEGIRKDRSACYPVHLETLQFLTMELQGVKLTEADKKQWCGLTDGMGLMLTDWYCGRNEDKIKDWLKNPDNSQHVYMHQRCSWEVSDVGDLSSPRVDYLLMYRLMQEGSNPW